MQAAQWGWLHSTPEGHKVTRLDAFKGEPQGIDPDIEGGYLIEALFEVGPTQFVSGAELPIAWSELLAYSIATGDLPEAWERRAVMSMSKAYLRAKVEGAADVFCAQPVDREEMARMLDEGGA